MDPTKDRTSDSGKKAIRSLVSNLPQKGILKFTEVRDAINSGRSSFRIAQSISNNDIIQFLLREGHLKQAKLEFPNRKETRYFVTEPNHYELALSVGRNCYFTHQTALYLHGLVKKEPTVIYVNSEQGAKATREPELTQEAIDQAFQRPPRRTNNLTRHAGRSFCLLNGKFTGGLGLTEIQLEKGS